MNIEAIHKKLAAIEKRSQEVSDLLVSEEVLQDPKEMTRLAKEQARLESRVEAWHTLQDLDARIEQAEEMRKEEDPELGAMAAEELEECIPKRDALLEHIRHLLIPEDPDDDHDVIMEIRRR